MSLSTFYFQRFEPLKWHIKNGSNFNPLSTAPGIFRILQQKIFFHALTIITSVSLNYPAISQIIPLATLQLVTDGHPDSDWTRDGHCVVFYIMIMFIIHVLCTYTSYTCQCGAYLGRRSVGDQRNIWILAVLCFVDILSFYSSDSRTENVKNQF